MIRRCFMLAALLTFILATHFAATAPASAYSAAVSADYAYADPPPYEYELLVTGYATCSQPTGEERVYVSVWQTNPLAAGSEWAFIACTSGPVFWYAFVVSGLNPWTEGQPVTGTVTLSRNGTETASSQINLVAQ
jgi:hypothetical protein